MGRNYIAIGNGVDKTLIPDLNCSVNDAESMSEALEFLGYQGGAYHNLGLDEMEARIGELIELVLTVNDSQITILFYFSGHGLTQHKQLYLLPTTYKKERKPKKYRCCRINNLMMRFQQATTGVCIAVLDCCRSKSKAEEAFRVPKLVL